MDVIQCEKGHFFDKDTYPVCPKCNPSVLNTTSQNSTVKKTAKSPSPAPYTPFVPPKKVPSEASTVRPVSQDTPFDSPHLMPQARRGGTVDIFSYTSDPRNQPQPQQEVETPMQNQNQPDSSERLQNELRKNAALTPEKTVSIFGKIGNEKRVAANPVVGWLVCIGGPHIGQSFDIMAGKNTIGRGPKNDIVLSEDQSVSYDTHAWVTYEPGFKNFLCEGGGGRYPVINGKQVLSVIELKPYDQIELAQTKLLFINLCGEQFSWENYLEKES